MANSAPAVDVPGEDGAASALTAPWMRWTAFGAGIGVAASTAVLAAASGLGVYFARQVVTPRRVRDENLDILAVTTSAVHGMQVILPANADTTVEGTYSLYYDGGAGHARVGAIRSYVPREGTVQRDVEEVYSGDITKAVRGWWSGSIHPTPAHAGYPQEDVLIPVEGGHAPAWLIRADTTDSCSDNASDPTSDGAPDADADAVAGAGAPGAGTWAIMVHGRGASRAECIRGIATAHAAGLTSLVISYRNDGEAPDAPDGRYGLGLTEWRDVEAAIAFALERGARDVVLFGWSMGGAISLQTADRSSLNRFIRAMVLDGPVVNWVEVLAHHARLNYLPVQSGRLGQWLISNPAGRALTGLAAPLDLKSMDWTARAEEVRTPTLILHSEDDDFVPMGPSEELARRNPDLVTFVPFTRARHTKEFNVDPQRWHETVLGWLEQSLGRTRHPAERRARARR